MAANPRKFSSGHTTSKTKQSAELPHYHPFPKSHQNQTHSACPSLTFHVANQAHSACPGLTFRGALHTFIKTMRVRRKSRKSPIQDVDSPRWVSCWQDAYKDETEVYMTAFPLSPAHLCLYQIMYRPTGSHRTWELRHIVRPSNIQEWEPGSLSLVQGQACLGMIPPLFPGPAHWISLEMRVLVWVDHIREALVRLVLAFGHPGSASLTAINDSPSIWLHRLSSCKACWFESAP